MENERIFTNADGNTLIKEFEGVLTHNPSIKKLDALVGFLRASGYFKLRPFLNGINKVRLLIGIDVDKYMAKAANEGKLFFGAAEDVKNDYLNQLQQDIENAPYENQVERGMKEMILDLVSGKLELRAHPSKKIHAKMYLLYPEDFNQYTNGMLITGSSNLSGNGLGISSDKQYEFNVKLKDYHDVKFGLDEFEKLWQEAEGCPIVAPDVQEVIGKTYLENDVTPYELYIKMLMEYFADRSLGLDDQNPYDMPEGYTSYEYQTDAVEEGFQKLIKYDGFFLADVVGLGKTVIATMIAKKFAIENGYENTKILVVFPPAVEQNWKQTFHDFGLDKYTRFITNGSLKKVLDPDNFDYWNPEEYDLVLVDEAHKFRNHTNGAFEELQEICKMPRYETGNIPGYKKKVMMISATPMNNTPQDLYNEILMFQDPRRCTIDGVPNLTAFFSPLIVEFKKLMRDPDYNVEAFKVLAEKVRDRIIKPITVRRTRTDIESVPRYNKDVNGFPKVAAPFKNTYELNDHLANLFEEAMNKLTLRLNYARYQAIAYLLPEVSEGLYGNAEVISRSLSSIRKNGLVKRLESSFYAFKISVKRFAEANQNMINMWENDRIFIAPDMDINKLYEQGYDDDEIEEKLNEKAENNPKNAVFQRKDFEENYIDKLREDQAVLDEMVAEWESVTDADDSKFDKFDDLLKHDLFKTTNNPGQKLVIFSESMDTVEYLERRINRDDVLVISAKNRNKCFKDIRENFDANYKDKKNKYNIIITTDVLAEGVNLHRSNIIVNYDTPWNATRLMQRIGRVNRIGSMSKKIYNYVFYPSREGNREIKLYQNAVSKIQTFHTTFGEDNQIYSREEIIDRDLDHLFDEASHAHAEEVNQELPYYEELRSLYTTNRKEYNRIKRLSLRSRTGRNPITVEGVQLHNDTLVFLKTNFRKCFYRAGDSSAEQLTAIEALSYFKATPEEQKVPRIEQHHDHVQKALQLYHAQKQQDVVEDETSPKSQSGNLGAQVTTAMSLLNAILPELQGTDDYLLVVQLKTLAERGVITSIAKTLQKMQKQLMSRKLTRDTAVEEIIKMARKYNVYYLADKDIQNETETEPEIILTESFC